jgi:hypothetical protein
MVAYLSSFYGTEEFSCTWLSKSCGFEYTNKLVEKDAVKGGKFACALPAYPLLIAKDLQLFEIGLDRLDKVFGEKIVDNLFFWANSGEFRRDQVFPLAYRPLGMSSFWATSATALPATSMATARATTRAEYVFLWARDVPFRPFRLLPFVAAMTPV